VARALLAACERLAREAGAPVFAFHTASFMTDAIALYERLGYRRAPEFDFDMAARYSRFGAAPITALAYLRRLAPSRAECA
jgi:ribosomal protein S18 acetylase RimI-like enzyme